MKIDFKLNGRDYSLEVRDDMRLLDFLREELKLTGTKEGCGEGECGACTVIIDGKAVNSCLVLAPEIDGKEVITVEGLERDGRLHPLQESFIEKGAIQCGFCTPGMLMSAKALLDRNPDPSDEEIMEAIEGNLCRCTGYYKIVQAIRAAAEKSKNGEV
ncbi:MAG: (2Fe-2S)-binding protein [Mesotoga sp.]|uniref:Nicotinate dehydrogenase small FeS subunit n=1 Tax=Mesotoga infera TaxID=1236046 RepID=A0A7Z7LIN0_9BACT|nr:(2Fe-2S)-binding protein [Mesotoga infera]MBP8660038.1 (2Fe-2S)-binding protein [Mesotoga sp.]SSC14212.1 Nicotinate dehydrogenase small FeS subunit [Mesotoga infera]HON27980.1 (2Fe-2S)-binding protein [Mesotoga infera]